jgi:hypothetical protein
MSYVIILTSFQTIYYINCGAYQYSKTLSDSVCGQCETYIWEITQMIYVIAAYPLTFRSF